mmetsp:Transcript_10334/g.32770  ORF Transcript_10334/g.32770 Transcript_10334/m.32770 type:complete len:234 (+) Transcript_10334:491-1192(+)
MQGRPVDLERRRSRLLGHRERQSHRERPGSGDGGLAHGRGGRQSHGGGHQLWAEVRSQGQQLLGERLQGLHRQLRGRGFQARSHPRHLGGSYVGEGRASEPHDGRGEARAQQGPLGHDQHPPRVLAEGQIRRRAVAQRQVLEALDGHCNAIQGLLLQARLRGAQRARAQVWRLAREIQEGGRPQGLPADEADQPAWLGRYPEDQPEARGLHLPERAGERLGAQECVWRQARLA